jgi:hypothetical protein
MIRLLLRPIRRFMAHRPADAAAMSAAGGRRHTGAERGLRCDPPWTFAPLSQQQRPLDFRTFQVCPKDR